MAYGRHTGGTGGETDIPRALIEIYAEERLACRRGRLDAVVKVVAAYCTVPAI
jgi:hypothetical protein